MASTRLKALFTPLVECIDLAGALLVIGMGTWELSQGRLSVGGLLAFLAYLSQLYSPIRGLTRLSNTIFSASAGAERIVELLEQEPSVRERPGRGRLSTRDLSFSSRSGFRYPSASSDAVHDLSFRIEPGETLALVGASGAGKSTVAKLLLRFYDPQVGRMTIGGRDLRDLRISSLRDNVALLLQETLVLDGTIAENIAYGRPAADEDEIVAAARAADAHRFISALPGGYASVIGQKGRLLSGGERQRLAIARAMIRDAPILILDEPTTGLDAESGARILGPLRRLIEGRTTIVISHNLLTVRDATSIVVLDRGRIAEQGTHDELLAAGDRYARLVQAPRRGDGRSMSDVLAEGVRACARLPGRFAPEPRGGRSTRTRCGATSATACASPRFCGRQARRSVGTTAAARRGSPGRATHAPPHRPRLRADRTAAAGPRPRGADRRNARVHDRGAGNPATDCRDRRFGLHLCSAIAYVHRHGVLHLDLKPSNVGQRAGSRRS